MSPTVGLWSARIVWAVLPVATGAAFADAIDGWPSGPARLGEIVLWLAWAGGLLALFAPRPWGLTTVRIVAPLGVVATIATITSTTAGAAILAISVSIIAAALALAAPMNYAAANALAYGDEVRFPLRIPTPLLLGPIPLAIALLGATSTGLFLLADAQVVLGVLLTLIGLLVGFLVVRSLHSLAGRWFVLVPAGVALVDPLTLIDPVLMRRETITNVRAVPGAPVPEALDLRLGTVAGGVEVELGPGVTFARRRSRAEAQLVDPHAVVVAVIRPAALLGLAHSRGLRTA
jgi:hypothetical protein